MVGRSRQYELGLVAMLCLAWGLVNFEMVVINYLTPLIAPNLNLSNAQIATIVSGFWVSFALSSYLTGELTDKLGKRKALLVSVLILFSVCSILSGMTSSFRALLGARLLMGFLEGPILPIVQSIIALESPVERRGMYMGIVQSLGSSLLSGFVAPLLLVWLAVRYGWRMGFLVVAIPGLICAILVARFLRESNSPDVDRQETRIAASGTGSALKRVLRVRNVWLCGVGTCLTIGYMVVSIAFIPLFYIRTRQFSPEAMSLLMSALGVSGAVLGIVVPSVADRLGGRPVVILASLLGLLCPFAAMYYSGPITGLCVLMFFGSTPAGAAILLSGTIPSESVPPCLISTSIGLVIAVGTFGGGVVIPMIAGLSADRWGLRAPLLITAGCAALTAVISVGLHESSSSRNRLGARPESPR